MQLFTYSQSASSKWATAEVSQFKELGSRWLPHLFKLFLQHRLELLSIVVHGKEIAFCPYRNTALKAGAGQSGWSWNLAFLFQKFKLIEAIKPTRNNISTITHD